jgi:phage gp46-like protein
MDLALRYSPDLDGYDIQIDAARGDFVREDTLSTAVLLSLLCDRTAQAHEVARGDDRRGWWADAYATVNVEQAKPDSFGSRLWLLMREKQLPETLQRLRAYIREALQWIVEDGLARKLDVAVFAPRVGWYIAQVDIELRDDNRRFRFEWNPEAQVWRLAGELQ